MSDPITFNEQEYAEYGNALGQMVYDAMMAAAFQMASDKGAVLAPGMSMDISPLAGGVIGGLLNFLLGKGVPLEQAREEIMFRVDEIGPQVAIGLAAREAGASDVQGGHA